MRIGTGWMLGTVAGVIVGFAIGLSTLARGVGITFISALFPIPKIALLPLLILWLGIGEEPKIATIALGVFFSTAISVYSGVDAVPRNLIRMAQSFNVPFHAIVRRVIWPGALPSILAGFRITASVALLLVVSAEMIGAEFGIGAFVLQAGNLMQTDQLLAGVVILSLFGLAVGKLINCAGSAAAALAVRHVVTAGRAKRRAIQSDLVEKPVGTVALARTTEPTISTSRVAAVFAEQIELLLHRAIGEAEQHRIRRRPRG